MYCTAINTTDACDSNITVETTTDGWVITQHNTLSERSRAATSASQNFLTAHCKVFQRWRFRRLDLEEHKVALASPALRKALRLCTP